MQINIKFNKLAASNAIVSYIYKRLKARKYQTGLIDQIEVHANKNSEKGNEKYGITLEIHSGGKYFALKERGNDIYQLIDVLSTRLRNKLIKETQKSYSFY